MQLSKITSLLFLYVFLLTLLSTDVRASESNTFLTPIKVYIDKYKKPFHLCVDTGSSFSWVISKNVRVNSHVKYDNRIWQLHTSKPLLSNTYNNHHRNGFQFHKLKRKHIIKNMTLKKRYGDGTLIKGFYTKRKLKLKFETGKKYNNINNKIKHNNNKYLIKNNFTFGLVNEINEYWSPPFEQSNCDGYIGFAPFNTMKNKNNFVNDYILKNIGEILFKIGPNGFQIFNEYIGNKEFLSSPSSSWIPIIRSNDNKYWKINAINMTVYENKTIAYENALETAESTVQIDATVNDGITILEKKESDIADYQNNVRKMPTIITLHLDSGAGGIFLPYSILRNTTNVNSTWGICFFITSNKHEPPYEKDERKTMQFNIDNLILGQNLSFWKGGSSRSEIILGAPFFKKYNVSFHVNTMKDSFKIKIN
jgi:hypothetical protein